MYEEQVQRGAAWLDEHALEGWRDRIDLGKLDIDNQNRCILGQLWGDYFTALRQTEFPMGLGATAVHDYYEAVAAADRDHWARDHGFLSAPAIGFSAESLEDSRESSKLLEDQWAAYLRRTRQYN